MTQAPMLPIDPAKAWVSQELKHPRTLFCCAFSPCGKYVVAGAEDDKVIRWELANSAAVTLAGHKSWVHSLAFSPDKQRLFSTDFQGVVHAWNYQEAEPKPVWSIVDAHRGWIVQTRVSPDGTLLATAGVDGLVRLWNTADGKPVRDLAGHNTEVYSLAFHPDGKSLASGDLLGAIHVWEIATGQLVRKLDAKPLHTRKEEFLADVGGVRSLAFNAAGTLLAAGGMTDAEGNTFCPGKPAVLLFDWAGGTLKQTLRPKHKSDGPIKGLTFLADGTLAAHAEMIHTASSLEFWKPDAAESFHTIARDSGYWLDVHPDNTRLAVASFAPIGRTGNGRHSKPEEYVPNGGAVVSGIL